MRGLIDNAMMLLVVVAAVMWGYVLPTIGLLYLIGGILQ